MADFLHKPLFHFASDFLVPQSDAAKALVADMAFGPDVKTQSGWLVVERRYIETLLAELVADGYSIEAF